MRRTSTANSQHLTNVLGFHFVIRRTCKFIMTCVKILLHKNFEKGIQDALTCSKEGTLQVSSESSVASQAVWNIHDNSEDSNHHRVVAFQAWNGKYLSAKSDGTVKADADSIQAWELWTLVPSTGVSFAMKSHHGKYLVCVGAAIKANSNTINSDEKWVVAMNTSESNSKHELTAAKFLTGAGIVVSMAALFIPLLGFGAAGVAAGSAAAAAQSAFYGGATCGLFSVLQSAGATLVWVPYAVGGAAAAGPE